MRTKRTIFTVVVLAALSAGCPKLTPEVEAQPAAITYSVDGKEAYARVLRAVVLADLAIEMKDADAGIIQTEWHLSDKQVGMGGQVERRVRFKIIASGGTCNVKPQAERRGIETLGGVNAHPWQEMKGLTEVEKSVFEKLVSSITTELAKP